MISQSVEVTGEGFVVVRLGARLGSAPGRARQRPDRLVVEQGHYTPTPGSRCVQEYVELEQGPKVYATSPDGARLARMRGGEPADWWVGGGLARPELSAHFVVPAQPTMHDGRVVIYRVREDYEPVWGPRSRAGSLVVKVLDLLDSRHAPGGKSRPEPHVAKAVQAFAASTRLPVFGGWEFGSPASPGDSLEAWVRSGSGAQKFAQSSTDDSPVPHRGVKALLRALGFAVGPGDAWGAQAFAALSAFQYMAQLVPDGVLGPVTRQALRQSAPRG